MKETKRSQLSRICLWRWTRRQHKRSKTVQPFLVGITGSPIPQEDANFVFYIASKGNGANLIKVGTKRRRTKAQIIQEKQDSIAKEAEIQAKLAKFDEIMQTNALLHQQAQSNQAAAEILTDLVKKGIVDKDENGQVSLPSSPDKGEEF